MIDPRIIEEFDRRAPFRLGDALVVCLCIIGSDSHGTKIPPTHGGVDDLDYLMVVLPPLEFRLGLSRWDGVNFARDELDVVVYSFEKFMGLLAKSNPNVVSLLYLRPEHVVVRSAAWERILAAKELFATQDLYGPIMGYAQGQRARMQAYTPEIDAEILALTEALERAGWPLASVMEGRSLPMPVGLEAGEANEKAQRLRSLRAKFHAAYMGEKRRSMVREFGYDCKMAGHVIRLTRMCCEFLLTGDLQVYRTRDADQLKQIKSGAWPLDRVTATVDDLDVLAKAARKASLLPTAVDRSAVDRLVYELQARELATDYAELMIARR
jgi:hypothetical protein